MPNVDFAVYRTRHRDNDKVWLDVPFILVEKQDRRSAVCITDKGRRMKERAMNLESVKKGCTKHQACRKALNVLTTKFMTMSHLRACSRDANGVMQIKALSPCDFTKQWGQFSDIMEPAKSAFDAYEGRPPPPAATQGAEAPHKAGGSGAVLPGGKEGAPGVPPPPAPQPAPQPAAEPSQPPPQDTQQPVEAVKKRKKRKRVPAPQPEAAGAEIPARERDPQPHAHGQAEEPRRKKKRKKRQKAEGQGPAEPKGAGPPTGKVVRKTQRQLEAAEAERTQLTGARAEQSRIANELPALKAELKKEKQHYKSVKANIANIKQKIEAMASKFQNMREIIAEG